MFIHLIRLHQKKKYFDVKLSLFLCNQKNLHFISACCNPQLSCTASQGNPGKMGKKGREERTAALGLKGKENKGLRLFLHCKHFLQPSTNV